ncbi:MAG: EF-P lysine aminoacylase EpmA [Kiritimatiellia bacterium]|jgi:lysyl-tRNA synthetase class 2|nr:EF-P lysine aminoacylase EpmA [Planctomycetota bacterium]MDP6630037.1 EF-P lysine aminoacylase EpmA [Kiritimatiellia bacterium]
MPDALVLRSRVLQAIRTFFVERDYIEVETPVRLPAPALELHIDAEPAGEQWLRTSPELHLKRLLAAGHPRIFELGPCFRRGERGRLHRPEFTMLEWYRSDADYRDTLVECRELLVYVARDVLDGSVIMRDGRELELGPEWAVQTVAEAFGAHAGWNPVSDYDADRFDLDLVNKVEPELSRDVPAILMDYPVEAAALARCRPGSPPVAERWELYVAGLELANAFTELTDPVEQRRRFLECAEARKMAQKPVYPLDEAFLKALESGLKPCSGVALGVDRLVMLLGDFGDIDDVRAF